MAAMPKRGYSPVCLAALCCVAFLLIPASAAAGTLSPSPTSLEFGAVVVGTGTEKAVTFVNEGTKTMVGTATLEGPDSDQFEIEAEGSNCDEATLEDTQSCVINLAFRPTGTGVKEATLVVQSDAANTTILVSLQGEGISPQLSIDPSPFDFGSFAPGSRSPQQAFAVEDTGSSAATIGAVALSGADSGQFQITADACSSAALGPGDRCEIGVVFAPTSSGAKSATLAVPSDGPGSPVTVPISGSGAPAPPPSAGGAAAAQARAKPSNRFSFGKVIFNRGRGTASLSIRVPGPGVVVLSGKGILARRGPGAAIVLGGAGVARLAIAAAGRRRAALSRSGAAKVVARVTYTPNGGDPLTKTRPIGLRKRRCGAAARCRRGPAARRRGSEP
jgi:hypothetical protein